VYDELQEIYSTHRLIESLIDAVIAEQNTQPAALIALFPEHFYTAAKNPPKKLSPAKNQLSDSPLKNPSDRYDSC